MAAGGIVRFIMKLLYFDMGAPKWYNLSNKMLVLLST